MSSGFFVGRREEIKELNFLLTKKKASLVVIKGRRRIGKSTLVEEFSKKSRFRFLQFSGIPPTKGITAQVQREIFAKKMADQLELPGLAATDWSDLFTLLARQIQKGKVILLFDEISWMGSEDPTFLGKLKNAWDANFPNKQDGNFILNQDEAN